MGRGGQGSMRQQCGGRWVVACLHYLCHYKTLCSAQRNTPKLPPICLRPTWRWPISTVSSLRCSNTRPSANSCASAVAGSGGGTSRKKWSVTKYCRVDDGGRVDAGCRWMHARPIWDAATQPAVQARQSAGAAASYAGAPPLLCPCAPTACGSSQPPSAHQGRIHHRQHREEPPISAVRLGGPTLPALATHTSFVVLPSEMAGRRCQLPVVKACQECAPPFGLVKTCSNNTRPAALHTHTHKCSQKT